MRMKYELIVGLDVGTPTFETQTFVFDTRELAEQAEELTEDLYGEHLWWTCIRPQKEKA